MSAMDQESKLNHLYALMKPGLSTQNFGQASHEQFECDSVIQLLPQLR